MKIFFSEMHNTVAKSFALCLNKEDTLYLPGETFAPPSTFQIAYGRKYKSNEEIQSFYLSNKIEVLEVDQLFDSKIDVLIIGCYEHVQDMLKISKNLPYKHKVVFYSGNDYSPFDYSLIQNMICADKYSSAVCKKHNINHLDWWPPIDYNEFSPSLNDTNVFYSFINDYQKCFDGNKGHGLFQQIQKSLRPVLNIKIENIQGKLKPEISGLMKECAGIFHVKYLEGYGYTIIEGLACGRPMFMYRPFKQNNTYNNWCIDGKTCFYFDDGKELLAKITPYLQIKEYRHYIQQTCSNTIRNIINTEEQKTNLLTFLNSTI